jgi:hypothetical protein
VKAARQRPATIVTGAGARREVRGEIGTSCLPVCASARMRPARRSRRRRAAGVSDRRHPRAGVPGRALGRRRRRTGARVLLDPPAQGRGRAAATQQAAGAALTQAAHAHFAPLLARRGVGLTVQVDEGAEVFDATVGNLHALYGAGGARSA